MKFKKFFKATDARGLVVKNGSDSWLLCNGVGMLIPTGVNALGVAVSPEPLFKAIVTSEPEDDFLELYKAVIPYPDGKAKDIIRVFETTVGEQIGITNADFGLLEKGDRLTYLEIEADDPAREGETKISRIMVVRDRKDEVIGYITGVDAF